MKSWCSIASVLYMFEIFHKNVEEKKCMLLKCVPLILPISLHARHNCLAHSFLSNDKLIPVKASMPSLLV